MRVRRPVKVAAFAQWASKGGPISPVRVCLNRAGHHSRRTGSIREKEEFVFSLEKENNQIKMRR